MKGATGVALAFPIRNVEARRHTNPTKYKGTERDVHGYVSTLSNQSLIRYL